MEQVSTAATCQQIKNLEEGEVCCHGTYLRHLRGIMEHGLIAGGTNESRSQRNEIYFTTQPPGRAVRSGMRPDCEIVVYVDFAKVETRGFPSIGVAMM